MKIIQVDPGRLMHCKYSWLLRGLFVLFLLAPVSGSRAGSTFSGHFIEAAIDHYFSGTPMLANSRIYRSNVAVRGIFGQGWFSPFDQRLIFDSSKRDRIQIMTDQNFGFELFKNPPRMKDKVTRVIGLVDPGNELEKTKFGYIYYPSSSSQKYHFDKKGLLTRLDNGRGASLEIVRKKGLIQQLRGPGNKIWRLKYDTYKHLLAISESKAKPISSYKYQSGLLVQAQTGMLPPLVYGYNSSKQLTKVFNRHHFRDYSLIKYHKKSGRVLALRESQKESKFFRYIDALKARKEFKVQELVARNIASVRPRVGKVNEKKLKVVAEYKLLVKSPALKEHSKTIYRVEQILSSNGLKTKASKTSRFPNRCCREYRAQRSPWGSVKITYNRWGQETRVLIPKKKLEVLTEYQGPERRLTKNTVQNFEAKKTLKHIASQTPSNVISKLSVGYAKNGLPKKIQTQQALFTMKYNQYGSLKEIRAKWRGLVATSGVRQRKASVTKPARHYLKFVYGRENQLTEIISAKYGSSRVSKFTLPRELPLPGKAQQTKTVKNRPEKSTKKKLAQIERQQQNRLAMELSKVFAVLTSELKKNLRFNQRKNL